MFQLLNWFYINPWVWVFFKLFLLISLSIPAGQVGLSIFVGFSCQFGLKHTTYKIKALRPILKTGNGTGTEQHIFLCSPRLPDFEAKLSADQAVKRIAKGYINVLPARKKISLEDAYQHSLECLIHLTFENKSDVFKLLHWSQQIKTPNKYHYNNSILEHAFISLLSSYEIYAHF